MNIIEETPLPTRPYLKVGLLLLLGIALILLSRRPAEARQPEDVPPNFEDVLVATVLEPTGLAFTPGERLLITTQPGELRIYQDGSLLGTPALDLSAVICDNSERGLLGVAVDPNFETNHYIYLYYTFNKYNSCGIGQNPDNPVNRTSRFTLPDTNIIDPASEVVLVDNIPTVWGNHNAGDLHFGADDLLYISTGDGGGTDTRSLDHLAGRILRVHSDGTPAVTNPYFDDPGSRRCGDPAGIPAGDGSCQEIIAHGLRNPFRFAFQPGTNNFYINDVGQDTWEEIDEGIIGADYGWDEREGPCLIGSTTNCPPPPPTMTDPIYAYSHDSGCYAITGGAFVPVGVWPAPYDGAHLFADYGCGTIFRLASDGGGGYTAEPFVTNLGGSSAVTLIFGPHNGSQALYYTNYWGTNGTGQVRRVAYTGTTNQPPVASLTADPTYGSAPLDVTFDASGSSDPNDDPLTFEWDFDDGNTIIGSDPIISHTYTANGVYTATLMVHDDQGGSSDEVSIRIDVGNTPPVPTIVFPLPTTQFMVGEEITLQGTAADAEDGTLPGSALEWQVILHHINENHPENAHTHPFLAPTNGYTTTITAPQAEDVESTALSYLEIRLKATDSLGRSTVITQTLQPERVDLSFLTEPAGLQLTVNNYVITGPVTLVSWQNYDLEVVAPLQVDGNGNSWRFESWSDGGAQTHTITTPALPTSYTATFAPAFTTYLPVVLR